MVSFETATPTTSLLYSVSDYKIHGHTKVALGMKCTLGIGFRLMCFKTFVHSHLGTPVGLEIWDTGGQERYASLTDNYYRSAHAVLFCYDITERSSFADISTWINDVMNRLRDPGSVKILLVATKSDLYEETKEEERVSPEEGRKKALAEKPPIFFIETSAKDSVNITELFEQVAREVSNADDPPQEIIKIDKVSSGRGGSGSGGCCKKN